MAGAMAAAHMVSQQRCVESDAAPFTRKWRESCAGYRGRLEVPGRSSPRSYRGGEGWRLLSCCRAALRRYVTPGRAPGSWPLTISGSMDRRKSPFVKTSAGIVTTNGAPGLDTANPAACQTLSPSGARSVTL